MNRQAICEDVVGLWDMVGDAYMKAHEGTPKTEVQIALFERAHAFIIHQNIAAERSGVPTRKEKPVRRHSPESDELASDKQLKFIEDLGGVPDDKMSRKEASKYIEELKEG